MGPYRATLFFSALSCARAFDEPRVRVSRPTAAPNMNGDYLLSRTPHAPANASFPTDFRDYPGGVEFFEVYHGPITSTYAQVFWRSLSNPLPADIVQRFHGKAMAIVGLEIDQLRLTEDGKEIPLPINLAYNHHHDTAVVGGGASLDRVPIHDPRVRAAGREYIRLSGGQAWVAREHTPSAQGLPTSAMFSDGNGGEYRKSMHVLPPPFAQIVESPATLAGAPMQIDTWNRAAMNLTGSPFVPGPVPRHSLAPRSGPDAIYSGLLECPLTTRIQKVHDGSGSYSDSCAPTLLSCPPRHTSDSAADADVDVDGAAPAAANACAHGVPGGAVGCFAAAAAATLPARGGSSAVVANLSTYDDVSPPGCSVVAAGQGYTAVFNANNRSRGCCGGYSMAGEAVAAGPDVRLGLRLEGEWTTITVTGPADVWFGVGLGSAWMSGTYAITFEGGNITERKLGNHEPGRVLARSVAVVADDVSDGVRTVVLRRRALGANADYYSFNASALSLDFIAAVGSSAVFGRHRKHTAATLALWPTDKAAAVCMCLEPALPFGKGSGKVRYLPTGEEVVFPPDRCAAYPREIVLRDRNPTCDLRSYQGGLQTCHHGWHLLDAEQELPWMDQPLSYYKKFRIYFQEYDASFHKQIERHDWGIGADGDHSEYDVIPCAKGTPAHKCRMVIEGTWMPVPATRPGVHLVAVHHHCHAPTCLKLEMWNNDTGELLCRQRPVYGGTHMIDLPLYDEPGYIATPPCLWGSPEHGLAPPPLLSGVTIRVVAETNNTYGHHGEMALPEVSLATL